MGDVIRVENLSKQYRLGQVGSGTISHDVNRWWHKIRGKEDPYLSISESNDRTVKGNNDYVWALKDINFEVQQGEVLGIIGNNGAGKSTLLKILSRTTAPTSGSVKIKGRIASLLEVGTGFHPELSGRDNIFLNGAVLGMTRREIQSNFDEIVDFAGVERYIDTPVKRYSSGMYVRLAFAVAAHLEPEILIVDEVLAVGDVEFQKKCMGKMKDVSVKHGRTVLFVSHQMAAVSMLCSKGLLMSNGQLKFIGSTIDCIDVCYNLSKKVVERIGIYLNTNSFNQTSVTKVILSKGEYDKPVAMFYHDEEISIYMEFYQREILRNITIGIALLDNNKNKLFTSHYDVPNANRESVLQLRCKLPKDFLNQGIYSFDIAIFQKGGDVFNYVESICEFELLDRGSKLFYQAGEKIGSFRVNCLWEECKN
jgi:lipopolysaccharide transport system ATP-binding protein